jgi:hypothetical protein
MKDLSASSRGAFHRSSPVSFLLLYHQLNVIDEGATSSPDGPEPEKLWVEGLWNQGKDESEHNCRPNDDDVERPVPIRVLIDESCDKRAEHWTQERCRREDHHRSKASALDHCSECWTYVATFSFLKTSEIAPPDTERNAEPANPVKKRNTIWTATLLASLLAPISCRLLGVLTERYREVED